MSEILVGAYLFERLKQLGAKTAFGVPGGKFSPGINVNFKE
jgi:TPP-dependent 2-oxoacid decarboxylase